MVLLVPLCIGTAAGDCKRRGGDDALLRLLQPELRQPLERIIKALNERFSKTAYDSSSGATARKDDMMIFENFHLRQETCCPYWHAN